MPRFKTFANAGTVLVGDLNSIQDDYETEYATYVDLFRLAVGGAVGSTFAAGTYVMGNVFNYQVFTAPALAWGSAIHLDPADYVAPGGRALKLRLRVPIFVNAVAPVANFVAGLYPISAFSGAAFASPSIFSLGTVIVGSTVTYNAPALNTQQHANSGDFTAPAAGWYCVAFTLNATPAANSRTALSAQLQMRNV